VSTWAGSSTAAFTCCAAAANGACCRVGLAHGPWSMVHGPRCTPIVAAGGSPASGSASRQRCVNSCGARPGGSRRRAQRFWTRSRSRPPSAAGRMATTAPRNALGARARRHLLVDTLGLALGTLVHPADIQDRASARWLLARSAPAADPAAPGADLGRERLSGTTALGPLLWDHCSPGARRPSAGGCRSWSDRVVDAASGCAPTRSRRRVCQASTPLRTAGWSTGRSPGSGATGA
jgi:hypothetical protein